MTQIFQHSEAAQEWATSEERTDLFTVVRRVADDNEEGSHEEATTYTMPAKPNAGLALQYLRLARTSADIAMSWLIETAVGEKGYDALVEEFAGMGGDDMAKTLRQLSEKIQTVALGGLEAPKG